MNRVGYLGPRGTFAQEALASQADLVAAEAVPLGSVPQVISAVEAGQVDLGLVPLENSVEGSVTATLDTLAFDTDLLIQREVDLPVSLSLGVKPGTALADITVVISHPNPLGQCRRWLAERLPDAETRVASSTAEAARQVAYSPVGGDAAIANAGALALYGLDALEHAIEDHASETRFVVVGHGIPGRTGHDKTSMVCVQREDRPGTLLAILQEFAARSINLTKVESRPTKRGLGHYCFFIDCGGHVSDELVADALRNIAAKHADVKFLGSFPVAGEGEAHERRSQASEAWRSASAWIDDLRAQVRPDETFA
ncbi:MAG: prephenate dehydratase [Actinomycetes bacterium]